MDDRGHPLSVFPANVKGLRKYTSKNLNRDQHDYSSHISKLLFPGRSGGVKAAAWVVMGHIYPCSGAGTKTRPLAEKISLKSSDFDDVTLITLCTHSFPRNSPCIFLVFAFLSLLCMFACLSVTQSLSEPDHSSTSLSLSACHTLSPTTLCSSWPKPLVGSCELACLSACHCRDRWRSLSHMSYLQKMNREHPDVRGPGTQRQRREQVDDHGMTMLCCRQRDIHNWWSSFAALSHRRAPIVQHVGTWTSGAVNLCS